MARKGLGWPMPLVDGIVGEVSGALSRPRAPRAPRDPRDPRDPRVPRPYGIPTLESSEVISSADSCMPRAIHSSIQP